MERLNSLLHSEEQIWEELLNSEVSKNFLDGLIEQAKEELKQQKK